MKIEIIKKRGAKERWLWCESDDIEWTDGFNMEKRVLSFEPKATEELVAFIERPLREQIDRLAEFIMSEVEGEPSKSEGAVDCAIRLLKRQLRGG